MGRGKRVKRNLALMLCAKCSRTQTVSVAARAQITPLMSRLDASDMLDVFVCLSILRRRLRKPPPKPDPNLTSKPRETNKKKI